MHVGQRLFKAGDRTQRQIAQTGIHDRCVLALQQPNPANRAGEGDIGIGNHFAHNRRSLLFKGCIDWRKDRGDGNCVEPLGLNLFGNPAHFHRIKGRDFAAIKLVTAVGQVVVAPDHFGQIIGPVHHWGETDGGRQAQANTGRWLQPSPFNHGVGKVGGADHHPIDLPDIQPRLVDQGAQRRGNAVADIGGGGGFCTGEHLRAIHNDSIRIGAADINADTHGSSLKQLSCCYKFSS